MQFDSSRIVPTDQEKRPVNMAVLYLVRALRLLQLLKTDAPFFFIWREDQLMQGLNDVAERCVMFAHDFFQLSNLGCEFLVCRSQTKAWLIIRLTSTAREDFKTLESMSGAVFSEYIRRIAAASPSVYDAILSHQI
jgi:hypothetical protein